jgi:hypothetical protein
MKLYLGEAIIQGDIEASGERDQHLMECFVGMTGAMGPARDVVQVVDPLYLEWDVLGPLDKGEVPARIRDFGKLD